MDEKQVLTEEDIELEMYAIDENPNAYGSSTSGRITNFTGRKSDKHIFEVEIPTMTYIAELQNQINKIQTENKRLNTAITRLIESIRTTTSDISDVKRTIDALERIL